MINHFRMRTEQMRQKAESINGSMLVPGRDDIDSVLASWLPGFLLLGIGDRLDQDQGRAIEVLVILGPR